MEIPFTRDAFLDVFGKYNASVWPLQLGFYLLAAFAVHLLLKKNYNASKRITVILSFFWLWTGIVYHGIFFNAINEAATLFGILFILQGVLLIYFGVVKSRLSFRFSPDIYGITGAACIAFALLIYPALGYLQGRVYPNAPTFGVPCPTTIFTFGIFLMINRRFPLVLLIIPILWSLIGFSAAISLGILEDIGLLVSGLLTLVMMIVRNRELIHHKHIRSLQL